MNITDLLAFALGALLGIPLGYVLFTLYLYLKQRIQWHEWRKLAKRDGWTEEEQKEYEAYWRIH